MHEVLHPKHWKPARGYANGIAAEGRMVFTGGIIGWNAEQAFETDDFVGQVKQVLKSIVEVLAEAGAGPEHLVRLTWYVTDKREYLSSLRELGEVYKAVIGRHYPAMALVQVAARGKPGEVYNISARAERHNIDVVLAICAALDRLVPDPAGPYARLVTHVTDRAGHDRRYALDAGKLERDLGYRVPSDFERRLDETVRWYVDNRSWWQAIQKD